MSRRPPGSGRTAKGPRFGAVAAILLLAWNGAWAQTAAGPVPVPPPPPAPPADGSPIDEAAYPPAAATEPQNREPPVFQAATLGILDKVTGRARRIDMAVGETRQAGGLAMTLRACRGWPDAAMPDSAAFVEVNEARAEEGIMRRIFTGWMFAAALSVSGLEHPVYDVWLVACRTSSTPSSR